MAQPINIHLYRLLVKQGASEDEAEQAARIDASLLATKADLLQLQTELQKFIIQAMLGMTAIFSILVGIIVGLLRIFT